MTAGEAAAPGGSPAGGGAPAGGEGEGASPWDALCGAVLSTEMRVFNSLFHVFNSLTLEMRCTCHLELRADAKAAGHTPCSQVLYVPGPPRCT